MSDIEINLGKTTIILILACTIVYFFNLSSYFAFSLSSLFQSPWNMILNAFAHSSLIHYAYNMLALFIFGNLIELRYGSRFILILFLISVITANLGFGFLFPYSKSLGISGFIYALIGCTMILLPDKKVLLPLGSFSLPVKAKIAGPVMIFIEAILSTTLVGNIAHSAHLFGLIAGVGQGIIKKFYPPSGTQNKNKQQ